MSIKKRAEKEILNQNISNGQLPFFDEFLINNLSYPCPRGTNELTFEDYFNFLDLEIYSYKRRIKEKIIGRYTSFSNYLNNEKVKGYEELKNVRKELDYLFGEDDSETIIEEDEDEE